MCYHINQYTMAESYNCTGIIAPNKCVCNMQRSTTNGRFMIEHVRFVSDSELACESEVDFKYYLKCNQNQMEESSGSTCVIIVLTCLCVLFFIAACYFYNKSKRQSNSNEK